MKPKTYTEALQRLKAITEAIEQGTLDIDSLADKTKEAQELLQFCKNTLQKVEKNVNTILHNDEQE